MGRYVIGAINARHAWHATSRPPSPAPMDLEVCGGSTNFEFVSVWQSLSHDFCFKVCVCRLSRCLKRSLGLVLGRAIHLNETRIRNSDTKLDVGFWWDLSFVTHPSFVYGAIHLFGNGKRNYFFLSFVNETRIRNSNPETKLVSYRRKRGPDTKLRYESPNKNPHRSFVSEFRIRNPQKDELGQNTDTKQFRKYFRFEFRIRGSFVSSFV